MFFGAYSRNTTLDDSLDLALHGAQSLRKERYQFGKLLFTMGLEFEGDPSRFSLLKICKMLPCHPRVQRAPIRASAPNGDPALFSLGVRVNRAHTFGLGRDATSNPSRQPASSRGPDRGSWDIKVIWPKPVMLRLANTQVTGAQIVV
jgi:hypothetical protein